MGDSVRKIGGSMIAKILKKSKWGTPLDAYLELIGERPPEEKSGEDIDRGNFLEPAILEWTNKKTGLHFRKTQVAVLPEWEWATVSPDGVSIDAQTAGIKADEIRVIERPDVLLEIKAPRRDDALQWGEEGTDQVPTDALLQTHWGMMVTRADSGVVASLLGGELRIYRVARDKELEAKMLSRAKEFVEQHVIPRVPPPPEFGDDHNVLYLHPKNTQPQRTWDSLTEQEKVIATSYLVAWSEENQANKRLEEFEPIIKDIIGDASGFDLDPAIGTRVDWKANATAGTLWKQLGEELLSRLPDEEAHQLKLKFAGKPTRVLRPWLHTTKAAK